MSKFEVTDAMLEAFNRAACELGWPWTTTQFPAEAAITAAFEASGILEENYKAFTDGMEAAAQICGTLAEVEYDDADGFQAATGCEAAIMRVVNEQRTEQALNAENARLREIIEHAHNTSRRFIDNNKNTGKYFLHICDILKPHVEEPTL
jgi:hypothetical protein